MPKRETGEVAGVAVFASPLAEATDLRIEVFDPADASLLVFTVTAMPGAASMPFEFRVGEVRSWSPEAPNLYRVRIEMLRRGASLATRPRPGGIPPREHRPATLSHRICLLIEDMRLEWSELDQRIAALTAEFVARAREDHAARRLAAHPGLRRSQRDGARRGDRHGRDLPPGARSRRLAGPRAPSGDDRRQAPASRHYEARQHLPAHTPRSMAPEPPCRRSRPARVRWASGCAVSSDQPTRTRSSSRSPASSPGSPGQSCVQARPM